ncbi:MAG: AAA family ATPase [Defluviicoccus sp.]|nr:AAA family ATPase [Defluviicoccus sp.]MDE0384184.1 AAA family ATPase [Defluviicoccus sp.]
MIPASEFLLEDVRCFRGEQRARMRPITLLVGENSTGKTTFLGCYAVLRELIAGGDVPGSRLDFNREPFLMGSFPDIVRSQRGRPGRIDQFSLGFTFFLTRRDQPVPFVTKISFREDGVQPVMFSVKCEYDTHSFSLERNTDTISTLFKTADFESQLSYPFNENCFLLLDTLSLGRERYPDASEDEIRVIDYLSTTLKLNDSASIKPRLFSAFAEHFQRPIPVAPLRSKPMRTYNPVRETASPEGEHIPMLLMRLDRTDKTSWNLLHHSLVAFGKASGLFSDIAVKRHGRQMSDPFQLQVKARAGSRANIMDVGYGVSQSLPILVDVRRHEQCVFLLQQPEVHLHPRAQAELASFFVESYRKNRNYFMVETHSDYIIDRVRILTKQGTLRPEDVSILYFGPDRNAVQIHNISLDANGNLQNVPPGYRDFFIRESDRLLGFDD